MADSRKLGPDVQRVTVAGLERFVGMQWKALGCEKAGCEHTFGSGDSYQFEGNLRADARKAGWRCDETGDWCPDHA